MNVNLMRLPAIRVRELVAASAAKHGLRLNRWPEFKRAVELFIIEHG